MLGWVSRGQHTWENPYTTLLIATHNTGLNMSKTCLGTNHRFFAMWSQIDTIPSPPADMNGMCCVCARVSRRCAQTDMCNAHWVEHQPGSKFTGHT